MDQLTEKTFCFQPYGQDGQVAFTATRQQTQAAALRQGTRTYTTGARDNFLRNGPLGVAARRGRHEGYHLGRAILQAVRRASRQDLLLKNKRPRAPAFKYSTRIVWRKNILRKRNFKRRSRY